MDTLCIGQHSAGDNVDTTLSTKYPRLFSGHWKWDGVGSGWLPILDDLCSIIQNHIQYKRTSRARDIKYNRALARAIKGDLTRLSAVEPWTPIPETSELSRSFREIPEQPLRVTVVQIKEKFGGLRFYYNGGDEFVDGAVQLAEAICIRTCETCGAPGKLSATGWIKTTCEEHKNK